MLSMHRAYHRLLFDNPALPSQQETPGNIVIEIFREGIMLNRKNICTRLLQAPGSATHPAEETHLHELIKLLFQHD